MKHTVFVACLGLMLLFAGCAGKKTAAPESPERQRVVEVEQIATVLTMEKEDGSAVLLIPGSALFMRGQLEGVQVVGDDGTLSIRWIRTGDFLDEGIVVLSGLEEGEKVVAPFADDVREGDGVTVRKED